MANIHIAFSCGLESTAALVKALKEGHNVILSVINVSNNHDTFAFEYINAQRIVEAVKTLNYPGTVREVMGMAKCPYEPARQGRDAVSHMVCNNVTQQFCVLLGMMDIQRYHLKDYRPVVWIGWIKDDIFESSWNPYDFSAEQYEQLLNLPRQMTVFSNSDRTGPRFYAPLWNLSKQEILDIIPQELRHLVIHTGSGESYSDKIVYNVYDHKRSDWKLTGIKEEMCGEHWEYQVSELSAAERYLAGRSTPEDVGLPENAAGFILKMNEIHLYKLTAFDTPSRAFTIFSGFVTSAYYDLFPEVLQAKQEAAKKAEEEKALAFITDELNNPTGKRIRIYPHGGATIVAFGGWSVADPSPELLERAKHRLQEQEGGEEKDKNHVGGALVELVDEA